MADSSPLSPRSPSSVRINIDFVCIQAQLMTKRHWASRSPLLLLPVPTFFLLPCLPRALHARLINDAFSRVAPHGPGMSTVCTWKAGSSIDRQAGLSVYTYAYVCVMSPMI